MPLICSHFFASPSDTHPHWSLLSLPVRPSLPCNLSFHLALRKSKAKTRVQKQGPTAPQRMHHEITTREQTTRKQRRKLLGPRKHFNSPFFLWKIMKNPQFVEKTRYGLSVAKFANFLSCLVNLQILLKALVNNAIYSC